MKLKDKYALVTGASTGIGRAVAIELAREGALVCLVARREEKLKETQRLIEAIGGKSSLLVVNLEDEKAAEKIWESEKWRADPNVDIIVNVAGVWHDENNAFSGTDYDDFQKDTVLSTLKVGLLAPMLLTHLLIPNMVKDASIINITGTFENGAKGWLPYYVSKRALEDFTVGLSDDLKDRGIKVNAVSPSDVATEEYKKYFPEDAKNALDPEDLAKFVLEVIIGSETGKVFILKKGESSRQGFHV